MNKFNIALLKNLTLVLFDRDSLAHAESSEYLQQLNFLALDTQGLELLHHTTDDPCHHFRLIQNITIGREVTVDSLNLESVKVSRLEVWTIKQIGDISEWPQYRGSFITRIQNRVNENVQLYTCQLQCHCSHGLSLAIPITAFSTVKPPISSVSLTYQDTDMIVAIQQIIMQG